MVLNDPIHNTLIMKTMVAKEGNYSPFKFTQTNTTFIYLTHYNWVEFLYIKKEWKLLWNNIYILTEPTGWSLFFSTIVFSMLFLTLTLLWMLQQLTWDWSFCLLLPFYSKENCTISKLQNCKTAKLHNYKITKLHNLQSAKWQT